MKRASAYVYCQQHYQYQVFYLCDLRHGSVIPKVPGTFVQL